MVWIVAVDCGRGYFSVWTLSGPVASWTVVSVHTRPSHNGSCLICSCQPATRYKKQRRQKRKRQIVTYICSRKMLVLKPINRRQQIEEVNVLQRFVWSRFVQIDGTFTGTDSDFDSDVVPFHSALLTNWEQGKFSKNFHNKGINKRKKAHCSCNLLILRLMDCRWFCPNLQAK